MERQLAELTAKMERSSAALAQFERELNVVNPEEKTSILSARLLQLNTEFTNAQAERVRRETALNSMRSGSPEAPFVSSQGDAVRRISEQLNEANRRMAEVRTHYGANHPERRKLAAQIAELEEQLRTTAHSIVKRVEIEFQEARRRELMLRDAVADTKREFDRLNARSFDYQALKREAEADKKVYEELVQRIKQAGINASFQNGAIRIADAARPAEKPVFPNVGLHVLLALLISAVLAVGAAIVADLADDTVRGPERLESIGGAVIASLPSVGLWRGQLPAPGQESRSLARIGSASDPHTGPYKEAIQSLRNSILLGHYEGPLRSLMFSSPGPGEGKSTAAANMAVACADQRQKVLLIDGDMRRPSVHRIFGVATSPGLSDALIYGTPWQDAVVRPEAFPTLDILPAGPPSMHAGNVAAERLVQILDEAAARYDLVILDSPPLLGFAEPLQMAVAVDGVVLVVRAAATNRRAVASAVAVLQRLRARLVGIVLNQVHKDLHESYRYYSYYMKDYYATGTRA
jgi:capsular exopolysaccharide synthesis family protein